MAKLTKNEIVLAKEEAIAGTQETPTGNADFLRVMDVSANPESIRTIERGGIAAGAQGAFNPIHGGALHAIAMGWEVAAGSATTIPEHDALYRAAGFLYDGAQVNGEDTSAYKLQSDADAMKTATIFYHQDGTLRKIKGARATAFAIDATTGQTLRCNATYVGKYGGIEDVALPAITPSAVEPFVVIGASLSVAGISDLVVDSVQIDLGLAAQISPDMLDADGYALVRLTDRAITATINPEKVAVAKRNWWTDLSANSSVAITLTLGTAQHNSGTGRVQITMPQATLTGISDGDRNGIRTDELTFMCNRTSAGNDELALTFD